MKTNWMKSSIGLSVHWTSQSVMQDGTDLAYREAVDRFDVEKFADNLANAGSGIVYSRSLTLNNT